MDACMARQAGVGLCTNRWRQAIFWSGMMTASWKKVAAVAARTPGVLLQTAYGRWRARGGLPALPAVCRFGGVALPLDSGEDPAAAHMYRKAYEPLMAVHASAGTAGPVWLSGPDRMPPRHLRSVPARRSLAWGITLAILSSAWRGGTTGRIVCTLLPDPSISAR